MFWLRRKKLVGSWVRLRRASRSRGCELAEQREVEPFEEPSELLHRPGADARGDLVLDSVEDLLGCGDRLAAARGESDGLGAPIPGVGESLDVAEALEVVDSGDDGGLGPNARPAGR